MQDAPAGQTAVVKLLETIRAPLGFFVLALMIVESFLAAALLGWELDGDRRIALVYLGVGMFVLVIGVVTVLVWTKPENLTFDKQAHLERSKAEYGTESNTVTNRDALLPTVPDNASEL